MFSGEVEFKNLGYLIIAIIVSLLWVANYWKIFEVKQLILPSNFDKQNQKFFNVSRIAIFILGVISWLLMSYSMIAPRKPLSFSQGEIEVNDIFFVLDVSRSMLVDDMRPNRLEVAKEKLREFVKLRPKDRIGVVLFSEKVFTLLPLTTDAQIVDKVIDEINVGFLGSGTNIGDGLALAVARASQSETKNKVIILLTDGVSNVGNMTPLQAADVAKEFKIKVYTIGIGTDESAKLPVGDARFGQRYTNIPGGSIDMETLDKMSKLTGAKSFHANSEVALKEILYEIEKLERTEIKSDNKVIYDEIYYKYLLVGVLLFLFVESMRKIYFKEIL